jgi:hypothetical protein
MTKTLTIQLDPEDRDLIVEALRDAKWKAWNVRNIPLMKWQEFLILSLELAEFDTTTEETTA